jgi:CheY-like chemotaxis protein
MDISMPVMDGIEATQRLRAGSGPNKTTHIIGLTAHGREEFRDQAQDAGMSIFHTKPIRLAALQSIISEVSQGDQSAEAEGVGNDQLQELCAALGIEKVRSIGATFFDELDSFITDARAGELQSAPGDLARSAHRVKGAAALLGQHDLEVLLAEIENLVQDVEVSEITERIEGLEKISGPARARYAQAVLGLPD